MLIRFLALLLISVPSLAQDVKTFIPPNAYTHLPSLIKEIDTFWSDIPFIAYPAALIEHESCAGLKNPKCWNPRSQLKTSREEGAGLGQITRAYHPNGNLRFDSLEEAKKLHPSLQEANWSNIYSRPDLQMRAMVLKLKKEHKTILETGSVETMAMLDAGYNGGLYGLLKERTACGLKENCNPNLWFNNVEKTCLKSKAVLYGNRNACDINRFHVVDVTRTRLGKYKDYMKEVKRSVAIKPPQVAANPQSFWNKLLEFFRKLVSK